MDDQRYVDYPIQGLAKHSVTLQIGKRVNCGTTIKDSTPFKISHIIKNEFSLFLPIRGQVYEMKLADDKFKSK